MGGEAHGQRDLSRIGGAHVHAAHAAYALSDIGLHALCAYRTCGTIFVANAAADALLTRAWVKREVADLFLFIIRVAGHFDLGERLLLIKLLEKIDELFTVACIGSVGSKGRVDGMGSYHLAAADGYKAVLIGKILHLKQCIVNGTVAVNGDMDAGGLVALNLLHAVVHRLWDAAAVHGEAEKRKSICVKLYIHAGRGYLLHEDIAAGLVDDVRNGLCAAAGAEIKYYLSHLILYPFSFLFYLYAVGPVSSRTDNDVAVVHNGRSLNVAAEVHLVEHIAGLAVNEVQVEARVAVGKIAVAVLIIEVDR